MLSKREIVLIVSLAFCAGVIVSDMLKPVPLKAEVTNIVYDTLDKKILEQARRIDSLQSRVSSLEKNAGSYEADINKVALSVKKLGSALKDSLADTASKKDLKKLEEKVSELQMLMNTSGGAYQR
jgi:ParB-like chromosome segregation protein Spo0J